MIFKFKLNWFFFYKNSFLLMLEFFIYITNTQVLWSLMSLNPKPLNHIGDVVVSVLSSSAVDRGFKPR